MESNSLTTRLCAALAVFVLVFGMLVPASAEEMTSQQGSVEGTSQTVAEQQEDPKPNEGLGTSKQEAQKAKEAAPSAGVDGTSVQDNANKQGSSPQSGEALATMEEAAEQGTDAKAEVLAEETSEVLTEDKGAAEQVVAAEATNGASISYEAHVQRKGWMPAVGDGATCGTTGQALRLEAVRIQAPGVNATVVAQAHVQRKGWMGAVKSGGVCGTVGSALRMEAIKLWLEGPDAQKYDIEYRAHVQSIGWTPWCRNGRVAGTTGRALRMEALEIRLAKKPAIRVTYDTHVQRIGWQGERDGSAVAGTTGRALRMEALKMYVDNNEGLTGDIVYQAHVQRQGWQPKVSNGSVAGTEGKALRMEAICVWLTGQLEQRYDVWYRTHISKAGWTQWACNGQKSGSEGMAFRMEAIQVCILPKGSNGPSNSDAGIGTKFVQLASVAYSSYVQGEGWRPFVKDGGTSGTTGRQLRMEGIKMRLNANGLGNAIQYRSHMQGVGWQGWKSAEDASGLPGQGKRLEAVQIRLTGDAAKVYDVWYRVHVAKLGWMGWACNGASAGTESLALRAEAMQVRIVRKGGPAPGSTSRPFTNVLKRPHRILVGDSRTLGMYVSLYGDVGNDLLASDARGNIWSAKGGAGYSWMVSTGVPRIESRIGSDTAVVILMGINGYLTNQERQEYLSYINGKAAGWVARGASVYYAAVTPVGTHPGDGVCGPDSNTGNISAWNNGMRAGLSPNVSYLDTYGAIINNYRSSDGVHYDTGTYLRLYSYIEANAL